MSKAKRFSKIYIEISNICNLQCSFCPVVEREKKIMSAENFETVLREAAPLAEQICLHLMGEPLAHPQFQEIQKICDQQNVKINLTTNGTLLSRRAQDLFTWNALAQINFSVHSYRDNFPEKDFKVYLQSLCEFSDQLAHSRPETYVNFRLWNRPKTDEENALNNEIINFLSGYYGFQIAAPEDVRRHKGVKIRDRIYAHFDTEFEWPTLKRDVISTRGSCYGLKSHIGIHADGTVVPCCLDKEAVLVLGNVLEGQSLQSVLQTSRSCKMRAGFDRRELVEELCQKCDFISRFG